MADCNVQSSLFPFETVRKAAESLTDFRVQSQLLSELARQQFSAGQFDAALQSFFAIPLPQERRTALLVSDFQWFPPEHIDALVKLLKADSQTQFLSGRIALAMLEAKNTYAAWKLVETAEDAFESEHQRYEFLEKVLPQLLADNWTNILRFYRTFAPGTYHDWASLVIAKYLAEQQRYEEAATFADSLTLPLRRSWAYWEMCRLSPAKQSDQYFDKALAMIESVQVSSEEAETMEMFAVQLRIYGRAAFQKGRKEQGEQLLELSEAAAASLSMPMQRYRQQCFLGKVLRELQRIVSIQDYLAVDNMLESLPSGSDRSRVLVWLAEAGWCEGWTKAIEALSIHERGMIESDRAKQIADVLKRCVAHHQGFKVSGDSTEDAVRISGEEFETFYFNPFAEADCGC